MATTTVEEQKQEQELQQIEIWKCKQPDCKAWTRKEFVTEASPDCPLCKHPMIRSYKHVPVIHKKGNKKFLVGRGRA